jgi:serine/threonine protein kinase
MEFCFLPSNTSRYSQSAKGLLHFLTLNYYTLQIRPMPSLEEILTFFRSKAVADDTSECPTSVFFKEFPLEAHGNEPPFPGMHMRSKPCPLNAAWTVPGFIQSGGYGCTYLVKLNSGELAVAKVMLHPTKPEQLKRLTVDLVGMTQIPPVGDGRSSLIRLLHLRHNSQYICMIVSTVRTTPISPSILPAIHDAYGRPNIRSTNWGFVKDIFEWVTATPPTIPCSGIRPYIILKQLLEAVNRLHKGGIIHRDIKTENVVVGVELSVTCEPNMRGRPTVTEKWNTMLIDLGWAKMIAQGYQMPVSGGGGGTAQATAGGTAKDDPWSGAVLHQPLPTSFAATAPLSGWPAGWHIVVEGLGMTKGTSWSDAELMAADIWACGLVFASMLFRKHPLKNFASAYALHIPDDAGKMKFAAQQWPDHPYYQKLFADARRTHGTLWEPILMRMMPPKGDMKVYVSAEEILREPLLGALSGDYVHRPEPVTSAPAAPVPIFAARPVAQPAPAPEPPAEARSIGGRDPANVAMTEAHDGEAEQAPKDENQNQ